MWDAESITAAEVKLVHQAGLALYAYTVNDAGVMLKLIDLGVDAIITDDPASVRSRGQPEPTTSLSLTNGLVAYWRLDDGLTDPQTAVVRDGTGANNAILSRKDELSHWLGAPAAKFGGCLQVDGTNAFVSVPPSTSLDPATSEVTISLWVQISKLPSQLTGEFSGIFDSEQDSYVLYLARSSKELRFKITDTKGDAARPGIAEADLQTNKWMHVVGTYRSRSGIASGTASIFLNGQLRDVHLGNDATPRVGLIGGVKPGQNAALGRDGASSANPFVGYLDDVAVWNRALTASEIARIYEYGEAGFSLSNLLIQNMPTIEITSVAKPAGRSALQIQFRSLGLEQQFWLLRAGTPTGPYERLQGLAPVALGEKTYRFEVTLDNMVTGWFRIEAR